MELIDCIRKAWGWTGIEPMEIIGENSFGNLIIRDAINQYWRLCPEDLYCEVLAQDQSELDDLCVDQEFLDD